ncbi:Glucosyltransferase-like protein [Cladochytrium tenue]|nr:Glucosyltransferase-like protein [Cladochytrium tenue]
MALVTDLLAALAPQQQTPTPPSQPTRAVAAATATATAVAVLFACLVRWATSLGPYSGKATPPMFGDFEAQRHWLEVTVQLPARQWYRYDLEYWGLDYPPLTAYHSWILGKIAQWIEPSWVALEASRGIESSELQLFMRYTALATDVLVHMSAAVAFSRFCLPGRGWIERPALIVVDHGHFQ